MADNLGYTEGTGKTIASKDVAGVHYQRLQVVTGGAGVAADVSPADPMPVSGPVTVVGTVPVSGTFWQATQPVSGTFYQATQPVSGTFWPATQPISGSAKQGQAASADFAINLTTGPLASDAALIAGRSSAVVDNTTDKYEDYLVGGFVTTGTSPTSAKQIEFWAWGIINDTPTYPDNITGSDANITITSLDCKYAALRLLDIIPTDSTSNRKYTLSTRSLRAAFGGALPKKFGVFVVHNTGVALNSTGSNHVISYTGIYRSLI